MKRLSAIYSTRSLTRLGSHLKCDEFHLGLRANQGAERPWRYFHFRGSITMRNVWTKKRIARLVELCDNDDKISSEIIAQTLNEKFGTTYSKNAVINQAQRLGLDRTGETGTLWPKERRAALTQLCNEPGMSFAVIAKRLNERFGTEYTRSAVIGCANRMGLKDRELSGDGEVSTRRKRSRLSGQIIPGGNKKVTLVLLQSAEQVEMLPLRCVEIVPRQLKITELEDGDCRYAYGDEAAEIKFCGHPKFRMVIGGVMRESSYCELHHLLSKRSGTPKAAESWVGATALPKPKLKRRGAFSRECLHRPRSPFSNETVL
jgi:GcrA cell cycle regulator